MHGTETRPGDSYNYRTLPALAAYIDRIGAVELNFRRFMIKEHHGPYYIEKVVIKIESDGSVKCPPEYKPAPEEAAAIKEEVKDCNWPKAIGATNLLKLKSTTGKLFTFWDQPRKHIIMVQERREPKEGGKIYIPWTFFSDGVWRSMEPDGNLPFWKPPESREKSQIMIHEGAKAAAFIDGLINDPKRKKEAAAHPWFKELEQYEHWGLIGGALAPHRTDYGELIAEKPMTVVYACDSDFNGGSVLQEVSRLYGRPMKGIKFGLHFTKNASGLYQDGWDLADEMPPALFANGRWIGPSLESLKCAATYATEKLPPTEKGGRPATVIKKCFAEEWLHSVTPDAYIHRDWPNRIYSPTAFDDIVAPFSETDMTSRLMKKCDAIKSAILKYEPGKPSGLFVGDEQGTFINTHCISRIRPEPGDAGPWLEFMEHLIPSEVERIETMRWCATLIARPHIKMMYALLLISETQGVGKSTLGERILGPIIGDDNTSYPTEGEIVDSDYTYWLAHKRLAVVNEIYAGHSSKAYNKLKDIITGRKVSIKQKYMANYMLDNWIHIMACSNNFNALKLTGDDRRWYIPKVTEKKKTEAYWKKFNAWLNNEGGLQIIAHWATEFLKEHEAVGPGEPAHSTKSKDAVVKEGYSYAMDMIDGILEMIKQSVDQKNPEWAHCVMMDKDIQGLIKDQVHEGKTDRLEKPATIRMVAKNAGWFIHEVEKTQLKDGTRGRLICLDEEDAHCPPHELFKKVNPTRIRLLGKRKLMVEADGIEGVTRKDLEDTEPKKTTPKNEPMGEDPRPEPPPAEPPEGR